MLLSYSFTEKRNQASSCVREKSPLLGSNAVDSSLGGKEGKGVSIPC